VTTYESRVMYVDRDSSRDVDHLETLLNDGWYPILTEAATEEITYRDDQPNQVHEQRVVEWMFVLQRERSDK